MADETPGPDDKNTTKPPVSDEYKRLKDDLFGDLDDIEDEKAEDTVESLRAEKEALQQQVITLTGVVTAAQADNRTLLNRVEEAKQATKREAEKFERDRKFALEKFVKDVLPVIDTLELGLAAIPQKERETDPKFKKLAEGVEKTISQMTEVFNKYGIKAINPINEAFDANKHEILATVPVDGVEPETVVEVKKKGYEIEGRVIRPAQVFVTPF